MKFALRLVVCVEPNTGAKLDPLEICAWYSVPTGLNPVVALPDDQFAVSPAVVTPPKAGVPAEGCAARVQVLPRLRKALESPPLVACTRK